MDRQEWLDERRREAEERYNTWWAPLYDEKYGLYPNASHQEYMKKFLSLLLEPGTILDAACGAGRYMPMLLEVGHSVVGIDQAQGMLDKAKAKFPTVQVEKMGLQEISYSQAFDGAICMDALEHVPPEDWSPILQNFHRALKPNAYFYFTVEIADDHEVELAFQQGKEMGLPIVYCEWPNNDDVYHYYPSMRQVRQWLLEAGFKLVEEDEGDGYHHFLVRKVE
jgi:2-polyprenyl-3-methyl-5-hydroxy-6-metoxy-1,4-benzoquinol methylase